MTVYVYRDTNLNRIKIVQNSIVKQTQIALSEYKNEELYNNKYFNLESAVGDFLYFLHKGYKILYVRVSTKIIPAYYIISCFPITELFENQININISINKDKEDKEKDKDKIDIDYYQTRYQQQLHLSTSSSRGTYNEKYKQEEKPSYSNRDVFDAIDII